MPQKLLLELTHTEIHVLQFAVMICAGIITDQDQTTVQRALFAFAAEGIAAQTLAEKLVALHQVAKSVSPDAREEDNIPTDTLPSKLFER